VLHIEARSNHTSLLRGRAAGGGVALAQLLDIDDKRTCVRAGVEHRGCDLALLMILVAVRGLCWRGLNRLVGDGLVVDGAFGELLAFVDLAPDHLSRCPLGHQLLLVVEGLLLVGLDFMRRS
jgi:hypothetical protein